MGNCGSDCGCDDVIEDSLSAPVYRVKDVPLAGTAVAWAPSSFKLDFTGNANAAPTVYPPLSADYLGNLAEAAELDTGTLRTFITGATRGTADGKPDYEGFLSPAVLVRFGEYMQKHQVQADGNLRASDNWQKGIPLDQYVKSAWRHFMDLWVAHRGGGDTEESLCALLFNIQGYLHETLKKNL